jgi:hypothetical protein
VLALLLASPSTATRPNTPVDPCGGHYITAEQFAPFSAKVWDLERWQRGKPGAAAARAYHRKLDCAAGPNHRRVMQTRWGRDRLRYGRHRHHVQYCRSGEVITGRVSYFGGGLMASGHYTSEPAIALNIAPGTEAGWDNATTRGWLADLQRFRVTIAGHTAVLFLGDLGPAGFTQRAIDVTEGGVAALGLSGAFPTDAIGTAKLIPPGCA